MASAPAYARRDGAGTVRDVGYDAIEWVCHSPSPYNDHLFRTLYSEFGDGFRVHYTMPASPIHPWRSELAQGYPCRSYQGRVDRTLLRAVLRNPRAILITGAWQDPTSELCMLGLARAGRPYLIWNDTPDLSKQRPLWKRLPRDAFLKWAFRNARAVMGTGKPALHAFAQMGCPPEKLVNFPYFIDLDLFPFRPLPDGDVTEFGTVARLVPEKGVDIAIEALGRLRASGAKPFRYRVVGEGPEKQNLIALARRVNLDVEFVGWKETADLPAFYQSLHFLLHPARFEPWGIPVVEAMATGCVVIATRTTAAAMERITDRVSGMLAGPSEFLSAVAGATALRSQRISIARRARSVSEEWSTNHAGRIIRSVF